jgi:adenosine deaminase
MQHFDHHRHFCGSIPIKTVCELIDFKVNEETLTDRMVVTKPGSFGDFLRCFHVFDYIDWDEHRLEKAFHDVVADVHNDQDLSGANFICSVDKYPLKPKHVFDIFNDIRKKSNKVIDLTLGIKYEKCQEFLDNFDSYNGVWDFICGVNFISREDKLDMELVKKIIDRLKYIQMSIGMHVGEVGGDENIQFAIDVGADVISHGTKAKDDTSKRAFDKGILVDVSLVSNALTSVIKNPLEHGFFNYINGDNVRLVSDDPVIFNNSINNEIKMWQDWSGCSDRNYK